MIDCRRVCLDRAKRSICVALLCAMLPVLLFGCNEGESSLEAKTADSDFFAMNTYMTIEVRGKEAKEAVDAGRDEVYRLERLLSRTDPDSEVSAINDAAGMTWTKVSNETFLLIQTAVQYSESTGGTFDITIAPVMDVWGFTGDRPSVPGDDEIRDALLLVGYDRVLLDEKNQSVLLENSGMSLDLGGVAKGYAGDRVAEVIRQYDIEAALINLGGNITVYGRKPNGDPYRVAIADPEDRKTYLGAIKADNIHVITSGGYERFFEQDGKTYIHIMDPKTAQPARSDILSVSVIDPSGLRSDVLSTALFVMGREEAIRYWSEHRDFGLVIKTIDDEVLVSVNLRGTFIASEGKSVTYFE
ncbi:MAG: FAD:protein FMN transferase [Clostridiales bacterium]|nr:FAD:protein FMN transferase [Clostridiales bacterium]